MNLGQFLGCGSELAFSVVNSKRVDFLVIDTKGNALLAIEYQGSGHYQGNAALRDEIKRMAFRSAGMAFYELPQNTAPDVYEAVMLDMLPPLDPPKRASEANKA